MNPWLAFVLGAVLAGPPFGAILFWLLGESCYRRGVREGQDATCREYRLRPALPEGWNPPGIPRGRDRACDHQMTARNMPKPIDRPVFYDR